MSELAYTPQLVSESEERKPPATPIGSWRAPAPTSLAQIRDLLLPAVHMENGKHPDIMLQIVVDYVWDHLVVSATDNARKHRFFNITRREIDDRSYLSTFVPNLQRIIAEVQ